MASLHLRHGRYYLIKCQTVSGKRSQKWIGLTKDYESSEALAKQIELDGYVDRRRKKNETKTELARFIVKALHSCVRRAKLRGEIATLTNPQVREMLELSNYKCSVSGIPLSLESRRTSHGRPFAPSIDRIDSSQGYTRENSRIVCVAANYAMNAWGEEVLATLAHAYVNKQKAIES